MKINILTIFPDFFHSIIDCSMLKKAQERGAVEIQIVNIRDYAFDKHHLTDEPPFGGGAGMVMKIEPIDLALQALGVKKGQAHSCILLTSAKGSLYTQKKAQEYSQFEKVTLICGHYQGVDERVAENLVDDELRVGDYVLTGGESATVVILDSIVRLIPGVLGNSESLLNESHQEDGLFGAPVYTRPAVYRQWKVPPVLLSGDHLQIDEWRTQKRELISSSKT